MRSTRSPKCGPKETNARLEASISPLLADSIASLNAFLTVASSHASDWGHGQIPAGEGVGAGLGIGTSGIVGGAGDSKLAGRGGTAGTIGADGTTGTAGTTGADGTTGTAGTTGAEGVAGVMGTSGTSGIEGGAVVSNVVGCCCEI
jgi:hypothetical protein